jgi:hypothetical protein
MTDSEFIIKIRTLIEKGDFDGVSREIESLKGKTEELSSAASDAGSSLGGIAGKGSAAVATFVAVYSAVAPLVEKFWEWKNAIDALNAQPPPPIPDFRDIDPRGAAKAVSEIRKELREAATEAEALRDRLASIEDAELAKNLAVLDLKTAQGMNPHDAAIEKARLIAESKQKKLAMEEAGLTGRALNVTASMRTTEEDAAVAERSAAEQADYALKLREKVGGRKREDIESELSAAQMALGTSKKTAEAYSGSDPEYAKSLTDQLPEMEKRVRDLNEALQAFDFLPQAARLAVNKRNEATEARQTADDVARAGARELDDIQAKREALRIQRETVPIIRDASVLKETTSRGREIDSGKEAIRKAESRIREGGDEAKIIPDLIATLDKLAAKIGTVSYDRAGIQRSLQNLAAKVDRLEGQAKYSGTR